MSIHFKSKVIWTCNSNVLVFILKVTYQITLYYPHLAKLFKYTVHSLIVQLEETEYNISQTLCILFMSRRFLRTCYLRYLPWQWRQQVHLKLWCISTRLHGVTSNNTYLHSSLCDDLKSTSSLITVNTILHVVITWTNLFYLLSLKSVWHLWSEVGFIANIFYGFLGVNIRATCLSIIIFSI
jgi:hypothetical protein